VFKTLVLKHATNNRENCPRMTLSNTVVPNLISTHPGVSEGEVEDL